jgi:hypothetical protein
MRSCNLRANVTLFIQKPGLTPEFDVDGLIAEIETSSARSRAAIVSAISEQ